MNFNDFLNKAWNDHAKKPSEVAAQLNQGIQLLETSDQILQLAHLTTHVFGEHLGQWENGVVSLQELKRSPLFQTGTENEKAIERFIAVLEFCSKKRNSLQGFSISDQVRILAICAAALSEQGDAIRGKALSQSG